MNGLFIEKFDTDLKEFDIQLSEVQKRQFIQYYDLLIEWNSFMNLTAITEPEDVLKKHFLDSVSIIKAITNLPELSWNLIDIGTGAGFPGIPIKILFPNLNITLLDSLNKRVNFLNEVITKLKLENIVAIHGRAEDYAVQGKLRETFNLSVSRAVANLSTLSEYCLPFVKNGGYFISYKSDKASDELDNARKAIKLLGGAYKSQIEFKLPNSDIYRNLIVIEKEKNTPKEYPRKSGLPSKKPL